MAAKSCVTPYLRDELAKASLQLVSDVACGTMRMFRLGKPDTSIHETWLVFIEQKGGPERIVLFGDLYLGGDTTRVVSNHGYGLRWFAQRLNEDYLAEKFLQPVYHHETAKRHVTAVADDTEASAAVRAAARELLEKDDEEFFLDCGRMEAWWIEFIAGRSVYEPRLGIGVDYHPHAHQALCAVQQRFHELYPTLATAGAAR